MSWWCKGQGISNHDIDYTEPNWFGPRTLRVNFQGAQLLQILLITGLILGLCPANERCHHKVTPSLMGGRKPRISPVLCRLILKSFFWALCNNQSILMNLNHMQQGVKYALNKSAWPWTKYKKELEQLERLCSEDTPRRLMITHTTESYCIPSQKKTKSKLQI